jgi:hypothetical protein
LFEHIAIQVMNVIAYPCFFETVRFLYRIKAKHFHQYFAAFATNKDNNVLQNNNNRLNIIFFVPGLFQYELINLPKEKPP